MVYSLRLGSINYRPKKNLKHVLLGMTIHRTTASKKVANYLHRANHIISYYDIQMQNLAWEKTVSSGESLKTDICKAVPTHSSIDNNDGGQEMLTGYGTTHHTNSLLFQPNVQTTAAPIAMHHYSSREIIQ